MSTATDLVGIIGTAGLLFVAFVMHVPHRRN
jgi:hypothetical protein